MTNQGGSRVALFLPDLPVGGVERVMCNLAGAIHASGFAVDLVLANGRARALPVAPDVRVIDLGRRRTVTATYALASYLRRTRPAGLVSAKDHANVVAVAAAALARTRTPVVVCVHAPPSEALASPERWTGHIVRHVLARAYARADRAIAISDAVAADLRAIAPACAPRLRVIPSPVLPRGATRAKGDREPDLIVWAGRFAAEKDPGFAIEAFAKLRTARPARLEMCGDGPLRQLAETQCRAAGLVDAVTFAGVVDDVDARLARASVLWLSSRREGIPTAVIEALAAGAQIVATDCSAGLRALLGNGAYGRLVPLGDCDSAASALTEALDTPLPAPPPAVLAPYDIGVAATAYLDVLAELGVRA
jgi:glycosyltransferase involved in cell wall biosynthesis